MLSVRGFPFNSLVMHCTTVYCLCCVSSAASAGCCNKCIHKLTNWQTLSKDLQCNCCSTSLTCQSLLSPCRVNCVFALLTNEEERTNYNKYFTNICSILIQQIVDDSYQICKTYVNEIDVINSALNG